MDKGPNRIDLLCAGTLACRNGIVYIDNASLANIRCLNSSSCHSMDIYANSSKKLTLECMDVESCNSLMIDGTNNGDVDIICTSTELYSCLYAYFRFDGVNQVDLICSGQQSCANTQYIIKSGYKGNLLCSGQQRPCPSLTVDTDNIDYFDVVGKEGGYYSIAYGAHLHRSSSSIITYSCFNCVYTVISALNVHQLILNCYGSYGCLGMSVYAPQLNPNSSVIVNAYVAPPKMLLLYHPNAFSNKSNTAFIFNCNITDCSYDADDSYYRLSGGTFILYGVNFDQYCRVFKNDCFSLLNDTPYIDINLFSSFFAL